MRYHVLVRVAAGGNPVKLLLLRAGETCKVPFRSVRYRRTAVTHINNVRSLLAASDRPIYVQDVGTAIVVKVRRYSD